MCGITKDPQNPNNLNKEKNTVWGPASYLVATAAVARRGLASREEAPLWSGAWWRLRAPQRRVYAGNEGNDARNSSRGPSPRQLNWSPWQAFPGPAFAPMVTAAAAAVVTKALLEAVVAVPEETEEEGAEAA